MCVLSVRFKPWSGLCHFLSCPIGGNSVTWPHLAARKAGKCLTGQLCSWLPFFIYFLKIILLICFLAVFTALHRLSLVAMSRGPLFVAILGLLIVVASLVEHRLAAHGLSSHGSQALEPRLSSCGPLWHGIFWDQGLNPCPLHWQADSHPLRLLVTPWLSFYYFGRRGK